MLLSEACPYRRSHGGWFKASLWTPPLTNDELWTWDGIGNGIGNEMTRFSCIIPGGLGKYKLW